MTVNPQAVPFKNKLEANGILKQKDPLGVGDNGLPRLPFVLQTGRGKTGNWDYLPCVALRDAALVVNATREGSFIAVEGSIRSASWATPNGEKHRTITLYIWKVSDYGISSTPEPTFYTTGGDAK